MKSPPAKIYPQSFSKKEFSSIWGKTQSLNEKSPFKYWSWWWLCSLWWNWLISMITQKISIDVGHYAVDNYRREFLRMSHHPSPESNLGIESKAQSLELLSYLRLGCCYFFHFSQVRLNFKSISLTRQCSRTSQKSSNCLISAWNHSFRHRDCQLAEVITDCAVVSMDWKRDP